MQPPFSLAVMETLAAGRIAFWEGGSLWVFDVPDAAHGKNRRDQHAHHAFQITFSLGGTFFLHLENSTLTGPLGLVAPDTLHAFEAYGLIAHLFIEPESRAGRALFKLGNDLSGSSSGFWQEWDVAGSIRQAFLTAPDPTAALRELGVELCDRIAGYTRPIEADRRVRTMIKWASGNLDDAVGMNEAARSVGLSPSRASHLFVEETGIPYRRFVLWLRLVRAVETYAEGRSLTDAAHNAGFSDSAHLSRTFKRMFGLPAASLKLS